MVRDGFLPLLLTQKPWLTMSERPMKNNPSPSDIISGHLANNGRDNARKARSAIHYRRLLSGLTLERAAELLGISARSLNRYESRVRPVPRYVYIMIAAGCWNTHYDPLQSRKKIEDTYYAARKAAKGR